MQIYVYTKLHKFIKSTSGQVGNLNIESYVTFCYFTQ